MHTEEKIDLLVRFATAVDPLVVFVRDLEPAALDFRPEIHDAWTIREHAIHFLDAETFAHGRLRLAVVEPGAEVYVWNEHAFQARARYETVDAHLALETARALRQVSAAMANALVPVDWETYYVRHAQRGRMSLADLLRLYTDHAQIHLSYLQRNLQAFRAGAK